MTVLINGNTGISGTNGSAGTPAVQGEDTNTGIFFPAADTVAVATGGAERVRVDSSGNVAIGATSATQRLSLAKSISYNTDAALYMDMAVNDGAVDNNATYNWRVGLTGNAGGQSYSLSTLARSQGSYVERVRIDRNGGFSIGTSDSFTKLSIGASTSAGTVGATPSIVLTNRDQTNATFVHSGIFAETFRDVAYPHYTAGIWFTRTPQVGNASSSSDIVFGAMNTNNAASLPSERMRLDSSGNLLVGTTSNGDGNRTNILAPAGKAAIGAQVGANGGGAVNWYNATGGYVASVIVNASSVSYNTTSDYRLKENVAPMQNALDTVAQLNPVTYTWKADGSAGQGFIAHELQAVVPDCVTGEKDAVDAEGNPQYQGVDTSFLVATLVKAIQELTARIAILEAK